VIHRLFKRVPQFLTVSRFHTQEAEVSLGFSTRPRDVRSPLGCWSPPQLAGTKPMKELARSESVMSQEMTLRLITRQGRNSTSQLLRKTLLFNVFR
jgi:hypothetical protein